MAPHIVLAALVAAFLGGCATYSADGGFGAVGVAVKDRGVGQEVAWDRTEQDAERSRAAVKTLLATPLTADAAVQVALLNNRGLQATYAELGIAESDLVQAGRLRNPAFVFERLTRGDVVSIERTFLFDLLGLLAIPARTDLERRRFALAQDRVAAETLRVAAETRRAWVNAVAARQSVKYAEQVSDAADASSELARRMTAAGNFSKLDQAREQLFHAEAAARLVRARQRAVAATEQLTRLMGLSGKDAGFRLPERLPDPPAAAREIADAEGQALRQRLDVQIAMKEAEGIAAAQGLTRATAFIDVLELGYRRNSDGGAERQTGYEIVLRLPIFDWGDARVERAGHAYMQAVNRAADLAVRARSEVREAYAAYRSAFDLAQHYRNEVVPLRQRISEESLLRYNGMLVSVFELLADARQQVATVDAYLDALREFWLSESALQIALTAGSPGGPALAPGRTRAAAGESAAGH